MPSLTYDPIDRLITASTASEGRAYTYDGNGNLLGLAIGSRTMFYTYENNRLRDISNALRPYSFQYDARGNVIHDGRTGFTYNEASQMTAAGTAAFAYDGLDMRVRVQRSGISTYFMYGLDGELLIEDTPSGAGGSSERKEYVYVHGRQIAVKTVLRVGTSTVPSRSSYTGIAGFPSGVTIVANINGNNPTGFVTFRESGSILGTAPVVNGSASLTVTSLTVGQHLITADYSGDAENNSSTATVQVTISRNWLPAILLLLTD